MQKKLIEIENKHSSTGACAMIALGIRWAVYVQQRQRLRAQIMAAQAGPLPTKDGVPVDTVAYVSKSLL